MLSSKGHTPGSAAVTASNVLLFIQAVLLVWGCVWFAYGLDAAVLDTKNYDYCLHGVALVFLANIVYALRDMRERMLFMFLHLGVALFILSRPLIGYWNPAINWMFDRPDVTRFTMIALFLSLTAMFLGTATYSFIAKRNANVRAERSKRRVNVVRSDVSSMRRVGERVRDAFASDRWEYLRYAALLCFMLCLCGAYMEGALKLSHMSGLSYEDYYLTSTSEYVPWPVSVLATMCPFAFCGYLATMPKRTPATIAMVLFVATSVPMLMIGSRGDFVLDVLFCALYYVLRSLTDRDDPWIGRREIIAAVIVIPVGIFAMGILNYTRSGQVVDPQGFTATILDAFYKQGVSYAVLGFGYEVNPYIQALGFKFFTIGSFIMNFTQNSIGQIIGFEQLGDSNSTLLALHGNSYAHTMSFFAHPNYLGGEGYGSSYILELFADFGYPGVFIGSYAIGFIFAAMAMAIGRTWFGGMIALNGALYIFHMPRGSAIEFISFIWTTRFIFAIVLVIVVAFLLKLTSAKIPDVASWRARIVKDRSISAVEQASSVAVVSGKSEISCVESARRIQVVSARSRVRNV